MARSRRPRASSGAGRPGFPPDRPSSVSETGRAEAPPKMLGDGRGRCRAVALAPRDEFPPSGRSGLPQLADEVDVLGLVLEEHGVYGIGKATPLAEVEADR